MTDGELYPTLHLLRALAAISIFAGHWSEPYIAQLWPQGQLAIDVFFMIEGFLSMRLLADPSARGSVGKRTLARFLHVYPVYALGLVAGLCAFAPLAFSHAGGWAPQSWLAAFVSGLLLVPTFSTLVHGSVFPLNPPTWAIVLELIGFALLAGTQFRQSRAAVLTIWAGAAVTFVVLAGLWHDPNAGWTTIHYWGGLPRMILSFFGGALLFPLHSRFSASLPRLSPLWMCVAFVAIHLPTMRFIGWPLLFFAVPVLVSLAASSGRPGWSLAAGPWAARNALMIYVLGYPVMMIWRVASSERALPVTAVGIALDFAVVLGTLLIVSMAINRIGTRLFAARRNFDRSVSAGQM